MSVFSSSGGSSPTKTPEDNQKYAYHMTVNKSYAEDKDTGSPPPTLPPRNYRPHPTSAEGMEFKFPHQSNNVNNLTLEFDQTPKQEYYADQLRQQARRISQSQSTMLNPARYPSKPTPETKVMVSVSRLVDMPPSAQEVLQPQPHAQPLYRPMEISSGLNYVGLSKQNSDSIRSPPARSPPAPRNLSDPKPSTRKKVSDPKSEDITQNSQPKRQSPHHVILTQLQQTGSLDSDRTSEKKRLSLSNQMSSPELPPPPTPQNESTLGNAAKLPLPPPPSPPDNTISEEPGKQLVFDDDRKSSRYVRVQDCIRNVE